MVVTAVDGRTSQCGKPAPMVALGVCGTQKAQWAVLVPMGLVRSRMAWEWIAVTSWTDDPTGDS